MLRLIRLQSHLRLLDGMLPICLVEIPQLNRRHTASKLAQIQSESGNRPVMTYTANPTTIPNHRPSSFHFSTHPTENEIGSATR